MSTRSQLLTRHYEVLPKYSEIHQLQADELSYSAYFQHMHISRREYAQVIRNIYLQLLLRESNTRPYASSIPLALVIPHHCMAVAKQLQLLSGVYPSSTYLIELEIRNRTANSRLPYVIVDVDMCGYSRLHNHHRTPPMRYGLCVEEVIAVLRLQKMDLPKDVRYVTASSSSLNHYSGTPWIATYAVARREFVSRIVQPLPLECIPKCSDRVVFQ
jgi:hypothetical protein